ncbi:hypothetical protein TrispH2_008743 [Trichoplax sp. H2]|uniref:Uncharacterized protein n=1 Tax=Trichoplax adhaerens TaxID=10228 RepID=B3SCP9_TRIAD|nr:predicted protein [Trichoplax adhaerens]EDV19511.1 predicted protein [Trichoplax adhaerens]RDD40090.1 hypothetical protein TrispH2_008743 [Trichoplax sp. H2]|eukprot:XP_002118028.1 predicted protein [Trichoplax adhaerens]
MDPCEMFRNLNQRQRSSQSFSESKEEGQQKDCGLSASKLNLVRCNSLDTDKAMVKSILKSSCLRKKACLEACGEKMTEKKSVCFARQASVTDTYSPDHYDEEGQLKECPIETVDVKESYLLCKKPSKICRQINGGGEYCKNGEIYVRGYDDDSDDENENGAEKKKKAFKKILWERLVKVCSPEEYKKMKAKCKSVHAKKISISSAIGIPDKGCPSYYNQCPSLFGSFT